MRPSIEMRLVLVVLAWVVGEPTPFGAFAQAPPPKPAATKSAASKPTTAKPAPASAEFPLETISITGTNTSREADYRCLRLKLGQPANKQALIRLASAWRLQEPSWMFKCRSLPRPRIPAMPASFTSRNSRGIPGQVRRSAVLPTPFAGDPYRRQKSSDQDFWGDFGPPKGVGRDRRSSNLTGLPLLFPRRE